MIASRNSLGRLCRVQVGLVTGPVNKFVKDLHSGVRYTKNITLIINCSKEKMTRGNCNSHIKRIVCIKFIFIRFQTFDITVFCFN